MVQPGSADRCRSYRQYASRVNFHVSIVELLKHENVDISVDVVDLLHDVLDPEMLTEALEEALPLVDALLEIDFL